MIIRTEFSFRSAYGTVERCLERLPAGGIIADTGCWGHVPWVKAAKAADKPRGLGTRIRVGTDKENWRELILVALSARGLTDLYSVASAAARSPGGILQPRADWASRDWAVLRAPAKRGGPGAIPGSALPFVPGALRGAAAAFSDNYYPAPEDARAWAFALGRRAYRTSSGAAHIQSEAELRSEGSPEEALAATRALLEAANDVILPTAQNIRFPVPDAQATLTEECRAELTRRGLQVQQDYADRLERELTLIAEKRFADYFLVIAELIAWAKQRMLVGPGRGSSAGSIVCWLLRITEIDPLRHGLLFERFIDTNRSDLPDIDIDFSDEGRESVLAHLAAQYGDANVAHIGTVMRYKPKSALTDVAKELKIPPWELDAFKDVLIERSSGDSRANACLADTFEQFESGQKLLAKYPELAIACDLEGGARQSGKHAAGMIVCNEAVEHFCAVGAGRIAHIDKKMAEALNILKIDALGLRTLALLQSAARFASIDYNLLYSLPLDDALTIAVFNKKAWSGIFQYEGHALQSLANQINFRSFEDIAALTALARPGPLGGGEATRWIDRHEGREAAVPAHPRLAELTRETYGTILYQEQVMSVARNIGRFSWADTSAIRKIMSDRRGNEAFQKYEELFLAGAQESGLEKTDALNLWKTICTYGSWGFNKSHAVAYGLLSYWCGWFKAHHPLAFAAACLRHAKDTVSTLAILRQLTREGVHYVPFDAQKSQEEWEVVDGQLVGGLLGIPGIGPAKATEIMNRRSNGIPMTPGLTKLLARRSVYENAFPVRARFAELYAHPEKAEISYPQWLKEIQAITPPEPVYLIGRLIKKNLRDLNEERFLVKRNGLRFTEKTKMLVFHVEDDTGRIIGLIDRDRYEQYGAKIVEQGIVGATFLLLRGYVNRAKFFQIEAVRWLA